MSYQSNLSRATFDPNLSQLITSTLSNLVTTKNRKPMEKKMTPLEIIVFFEDTSKDYENFMFYCNLTFSL